MMVPTLPLGMVQTPNAVGLAAEAAPAMATVIAAMTNATVMTLSMRLIEATSFSVPGNPLWVAPLRRTMALGGWGHIVRFTYWGVVFFEGSYVRRCAQRMP